MSERPEISSIYGMDPNSEGEYPISYGINGQTFKTDRMPEALSICRIKERGGGGPYAAPPDWYDIYVSDDGLEILVSSVSARAVAEVFYK